MIGRNGKFYKINGKFGNFHVYLGNQCLAFGIMTRNDAENWVWSHSY